MFSNKWLVSAQVRKQNGRKDVGSVVDCDSHCGIRNCSMFCCALLYVHHLGGEEKLVALFCLSSWCLVIVAWLFITMLRVCLQFVIVVFPDHTHLLFLKGVLDFGLQPHHPGVRTLQGTFGKTMKAF